MDVQYKIIFQLLKFNEPVQYNNSHAQYRFTSEVEAEEFAGYSLVILNPEWDIHFTETYFGDSPIEFLLKTIYEKGFEIVKKVKETNIPLIVSENMKKIKRATSTCPLCQCRFNSSTRLPAFNHDHHNGLYYSILCTKCNILCVKKALVIISHSFGTTDGPAIVKRLNQDWTNHLKVIARGDNTLITMTWEGMKFIDSSQLLSFPIEKLAHRLMKTESNHAREKSILYKGFQSINVTLLRKGLAFPFKDFTFHNSTLPIEFPPYEDVYYHGDNDLYCNSRDSFNLFKCESALEYAKLHTKTSVLLLGDILRHFVKYCTQKMALSPIHSPTLSGFAFDAAFCMSGASFEYIKDEEIISWISPAIRAGLSFANVKNATANCERLNCFNGVAQDRSHIIELDLTAAYPASMAGYLATGDYTWLDEISVNELDILNLPDEGEFGYIFEVNAFTPVDKMDELNDLPLCVDKRCVTPEELSPHQMNVIQSIPYFSEVVFNEPKLILDLKPKENYLMLHTTLKYYVGRGLKITRIKRGLRFKTAPYLKPASSWGSGKKPKDVGMNC